MRYKIMKNSLRLCYLYLILATLSELVQPKQLVAHISTYLADLLTWAAHNGVELNISKTKEMILGIWLSVCH